MKYVLTGLGILAIIGFMLFSWVIGSYNGLVSQRTEFQTQQGQIEAQLQRRFDLVPNLVGAVRGAMTQEQKVFKDIADARTHYAGTPAGTPDKLAAAGQYEGAISRLLVIMENYPQLNSVGTVKDLMTQLEGTENRISVARQRYNEAVQPYNNSVQMFPGAVIAGMFGFKVQPFYQGQVGSENAPKVDLTK